MVSSQELELVERLILKTSVEREKDVQAFDVIKESGKWEVTLLVMSTFTDSLGILRTCADFGVQLRFLGSRVGFEIFLFEGDLTVEHWDNIQPREGPNPSGHSMVDGPIEAIDLDRTKYNREIVRSFVDDVIFNGEFDKLEHYIDEEYYTEHNPRFDDGLSMLRSALSFPESNEGITIKYDRMHRILAEGNFVLTVSEGYVNGVHSSFFDLFRVAHGKIVEHWDTTEAVPPRSEWKNDNGKF